MDVFLFMYVILCRGVIPTTTECSYVDYVAHVSVHKVYDPEYDTFALANLNSFPWPVFKMCSLIGAQITSFVFVGFFKL